MGDIKTKETGETLDVRGASAFLKISRWTLYQLTRRNEIPCHRPIGKKLVFFRQELEEFIRNPKILK